jgi:GntR family transcriptional regulator
VYYLCRTLKHSYFEEVAVGTFEFDPNRPIYLQIIEEIKKRAVRGLYPPGEKLPSVREMAQEMGVNPNTMARAYSELERESFVFTKRGQGSFVTELVDSVESERQRLADAAVERFVSEIQELEPSVTQIEHLLERIKGGLL